jgi:hypothetical protein
MTFRANKNGTWVGGDDQSAGTTVYGKLGADWLYAKAVFANKNGTWERAWTDCRLFDAGGRDWSDPTTVVTTAGSCSTRTQTTTVTRTKTGCPNDVRATTVAAPDCTGCTGTPYVSNACDGCGSITTTPGTGGCPDSSSGSCGTWSTIPNFNYGDLTLVNGCVVRYDANIGSQGYDTGYYYTDCGGSCTESCSLCQVGPQYIQQCNLTGAFRGAGNLNENKCYSLD